MKSILSFLLILSTIATMGQAPVNWKATGIGGGGALFSPSINPANHNEIYMACDMSELFHTVDTGASWTQASFLQLQGGHDSQVQFTDSANILYTVDYTSLEANSYIRAMKSTNRGETWLPLVGDPYDLNPSVLMRLLVDPHNPDHVLIADYGTMYFSTNGGNSFTLFHTCVNNGAGNHIAGVYFDGDSIYIGTYDGLFYSTNGGNSFSVMTTTGIPAVQRMLNFAGGKQNGTIRFYCLTSDSDNVYAGITYGDNYYGTWAGVYTMDNVNGMWTEKINGISTTSGSSDYPVLVGMAENSIDTAYLSGGSDAGSPIVLKTTDGGANWSHVFLTVNNQNIFTGWAGQNGDHGWSFPEAPFGFTVALNDAQMVMLTDYSCAHVTTDGGVNWRQQYLDPADENPEDAHTPVGKKYHSAGMENTSNWNMMWTDPAHIFSCFSDIGGVMSSDSGASWKFIPINYNSIYYVVQHPNGTLYAATSSTHDMYQTTHITNSSSDGGSGEIYFSTDTGGAFSVLHNFSHPVIWLALDPNNADRMYASVINSTSGGIYVTNNLNAGAASTWTKLATPPRTLGHPLNIRVLKDGSLVASFSATLSGSTFSQSAGVFYSTDSGASWLDRTDPRMEYYTMDVVIDPNDSTQNTWYAAVFGGWGNANGNGNGLFRSTNRGQNWTQISNEYRVNSCTVNPTKPNEMYYTTETNGLWYTNDLTSPTPTFTQVSTYPFKSTTRVNYSPWNNDEVWVSSFGNGMRYGNILDTTQVIATSINETLCYGLADDGHNTSGTYVDTFRSNGGADSIRTLNLIVLPIIQDSLNKYICSGSSYNGHSQSGVYIDSFKTTAGCDSIQKLNLTVESNIIDTVTTSICPGSSYAGHNAAGTYVDSFTAAGGCDSVRVLLLGIYQTSVPAITRDNDTLVAGAGIHYQWYAGNEAQSGDTFQEFIAVENGYYSVFVTDSNGCVTSSLLDTVVLTGIDDINNVPDWYISPNPAHGMVNISLNMIKSETVTINVYDVTGRLLKQGSLQANSGINNTTMDMGRFAQGVYLLELRTSDNISRKKLMLE